MLDIRAPRKFALRYGENPHQSAALYASGDSGIAGAEQLHGKELSYNNLVDLDAAWQLIARIRRARRGHYQAHQSVRLRGSVNAGRSLPARLRSRSGVGIRRSAGVQSRGGRRNCGRDRQDIRRSHCRARVIPEALARFSARNEIFGC